jgi:type VI secretion system protein ImpI
MTIHLVMEHAPHPQPRTEVRHSGGELSIGRGAECDWQIDDPDMFISRRHCIISLRDGVAEVTDASRGGLFIDGADAPLGAGNSRTLESGMRLRMGDVVIRVELLSAATSAPQADRKTGKAADTDDFFSRREAPAPAAPRPADLPEPFDLDHPAARETPEARPAPPPVFDDPFTLDPLPATSSTAEPRTGDSSAGGFGSFFDAPMPEPAAAPPRPTVPEEPARPAPPPPVAPPVARPVATDESAERAAFLRGLGLDPASLPQGGGDDFEAIGRRFRLMVDGLVHLLRTRAKEKGSARVSQTVIGSADVNPLKFLPATEDILIALLVPRGRGYLDPEAAITGAFRDLTDHQLRTWVAVQTALRRMIDKFDPEAFEQETEKAGLMKSMLAGGRKAHLWQLYIDRYAEIAKAAEGQFLGEVGADFRDAYEGNRAKEDER